MTQIHFLTPEQEALIPEYQEKWKRIYLSTQPIEQNRAKAAVQGAYAVMGKPEPEVIFCSSPRAALERLQAYVETTQENSLPSQEEVQNNFFQFARAIWEMNKIKAKQQNAGTKPLHDLLEKVTSETYKSLENHIERLLPNNLKTQDIIEQAFLGASSLFDHMKKQQNRSEDTQPEDEQNSYGVGAEMLDKQLGWLPGKDLLFRRWLKQSLQATLTAKVYGFEHPRFQNAIIARFTSSEQKFLLENPPLLTSDFAFFCIWLDYAFSVLQFPHTSQKWSALQGLVKHCGYIFGVDNLCIICERPTKILLNEENKLHGEGEPAIEFADGCAIYARNGQPVAEN